MYTRPLTQQERALLDFLLTRDFPGREALLRQAETVRTAGRSCGCGCPSFSLKPDLALPAPDVPDRMPTDAHGSDPGGNAVGVLLFVNDGYLSDVEVYSFEGSFAGLPDTDALQLSEWSAPDEHGARHLTNPYP